MLEFLMMANNKCRNCGNQRIEVCERNLLELIKKQFDEIGLKGRFLHCPYCNECSIFSNHCKPDI